MAAVLLTPSTPHTHTLPTISTGIGAAVLVSVPTSRGHLILIESIGKVLCVSIDNEITNAADITGDVSMHVVVGSLWWSSAHNQW